MNIRENINHLNELFKRNKIKAKVINVVRGVTFTRYEAEIDPFSFQMEKVSALEDNISHLLRSAELPIIFPIYERSIIAIDVVNSTREDLSLKTVLTNTRGIRSCKLPLVLGYTVYNEPFVVDLVDAPHILVAGTTGSGKSMGLRSIVAGLLHFTEDVEVFLIDPKCVEMSVFKDHERVDVITDIDEAHATLRFIQMWIDNRYATFAEQGINNISEAEGMPYIVLVIDELADLFAHHKDMRNDLLKIIQKSRAAGVHVIAATQRPSVDIVSGIIKSNFPTRIAFKVSSYEDSRTILSSKGAERLQGKGDMLYRKSIGSFERIQGSLATNEDIIATFG